MNELQLLESLEKEAETLPSQEHETIQHLAGLGYIPLWNISNITKGQLNHAKEQFALDLIESGLFTLPEIQFVQQFGAHHFFPYFLRKATDIDNGLELNELPPIGAMGLISRIIHFRLELIGFLPIETSKPFQHTSMVQLHTLSGICGFSVLECVNLLADIEKFTSTLLQRHPWHSFIIAFKSKNVPNDVSQKLKRKHAFKRQLIQDFGTKNDYIHFLAEKILLRDDDIVDFSFLDKESKLPLPQLLIRLIQVHQWRDGFYTGLLDSEIGGVTLDSILASVSFYNALDKKDIKPHRVLTYVGNGYFLFNALFFLQEYMLENHKLSPSSSIHFIDDVQQSFAQANKGSQKLFLSNFEKLKTDIQNEKVAPIEKKGLIKRIFYGAKRLLANAVRFSKNIFDWIRDKTQKVWSFLKNLFRVFFDQLKTGLIAFIDGFKFLIGKKFVSTFQDIGGIISHFSLDGDSTSLVLGNGDALVEKHIKTVKSHINNMHFSLAIVGGVLNLIKTSLIPLTWPLLFMNIVRVYNRIEELYKKIELTTE